MNVEILITILRYKPQILNTQIHIENKMIYYVDNIAYMDLDL